MSKKDQRRGADGKFQKKTITAGSPAGTASLDANGNSTYCPAGEDLRNDDDVVPAEVAKALDLIDECENVRSVVLDDNTVVVVYTKNDCLCNNCMKAYLSAAFNSDQLVDSFTAWIWRSWEPGKISSETVEVPDNDNEFIKFSDFGVRVDRLRKYIDDDELALHMNLTGGGKFVIMASSKDELKDKVSKCLMGE